MTGSSFLLTSSQVTEWFTENGLPEETIRLSNLIAAAKTAAADAVGEHTHLGDQGERAPAKEAQAKLLEAQKIVQEACEIINSPRMEPQEE